MAKERVSALAKQIGMPSKQLIEWLNNNGEYVKTPSSTVEAPVVAKVFAAFPPVVEAEKPAPKAKKAAASAPEVEPEVALTAPEPPVSIVEAPPAILPEAQAAQVESPLAPSAPLAPLAPRPAPMMAASRPNGGAAAASRKARSCS